MPVGFTEFFNNIREATYTMGDIWYMITTFFDNLMNNYHIVVLKDCITEYLSFITPYLPYIILGLSAIIALFGNRIFPVLNFIAFFVVGFALGIYFLAPPILEVLPTLPTWVIGLITGLVSAVLSKVLFGLSIACVVAYPIYMVCLNGTLIPALTAYTKENWIFSLGIAAVFVLIALLLHKLIKSVGTAYLGGYGIAYVVKGWYDYTAFEAVAGYEWAVIFGVATVFAIIGLFVQYKVRAKY